MITIDKVVTGYGDRMVLNELSLNMKEGIIHGLVGLNGSGKSTLLKCLSSQMQIRSGQILKNGVKISRKEISMLETDPFFYHGINGREYLSLFNSDNKDKFNLNEWQSLFNIPLDHLIDGYSTGMKKKLAIVGILKADKPILLFDEPFNGLDIEAAKVFSMVLQKLPSVGKTVVITSHVLDTLTSNCNVIHYLKNGVIEKTFDTFNNEIIDKAIFQDLDIDIAKRIDLLF